MSKEQANEFLKKLYTDRETAEKFQEAFRALVVKAGKDTGFTFTTDDLKAALAEAKTEELSEDALKGVAGGFQCTPWGLPFKCDPYHCGPFQCGPFQQWRPPKTASFL